MLSPHCTRRIGLTLYHRFALAGDGLHPVSRVGGVESWLCGKFGKLPPLSASSWLHPTSPRVACACLLNLWGGGWEKQVEGEEIESDLRICCTTDRIDSCMISRIYCVYQITTNRPKTPMWFFFDMAPFSTPGHQKVLVHFEGWLGGGGFSCDAVKVT